MGESIDQNLMARWSYVQNVLENDKNLSSRWKAFVKMAQPQAHMGSVVLVAVPNEYTRDVLQTKINREFDDALKAAFGPDISSAIVIDQGLQEESALETAPAEQIEEPAVAQMDSGSRRPSLPSLQELEAELGQSSPDFAQSSEAIVEESEIEPEEIVSEGGEAEVTWDSSARLNPRYTFDTFVTGQSNRFAQAAAFAVSETPATAYNPLFIYGGSGLGKTHLLHAIGHYAKHLYPDLRVRYVNSEEFTNDFINSIRDDEGSSFKQIYRNVDMLLIDDIQFLAGKEHTQEEFFHTFNALYNHQKQVVITSDLQPKQLTGFADRMRSRFEWGLITDVQPPELETRIAILRKKAQSESLDVPDDVMEYIASNIATNIRELEGALIRVTAFGSLNKQKVDLPLAEQVLKDLITDDGAQEITAAQVLLAATEYFNVSLEELQSKSRNRTLTTARQIAMYLLRELTDMSLPKIGQELGNRDHTTVMHADRKIRALMAERRQTFDQVTELTNKIKQEQRAQK